MTKQDLSKIKYVHRIYSNWKKEVHMEKYPVIYSNHEYVYYKPRGDTRLSVIRTERILTDYPKIFTKDSDDIFWTTDEKIKDIFEWCKIQVKDNEQRRQFVFVKERYICAKNEYEKAKAAYEAYQEYIAKKGDGENHEQ